MTSITENRRWADKIYQIARNDKVEGGRDGTANIQAAQLADRTQYLKTLIEGMTDYREYTFYKSESDPEGVISGLANTPEGKLFRVAQSLTDDLAFIYYLNDSGRAIPVTALLGRGAITNNIREYTSLALAQDDVASGNILDGSRCWVANTTNEILADEFINNGGTLELTGRQMLSKKSVEGVAFYKGYIPLDSAYRVLDGKALDVNGILVSRKDTGSLVLACAGYSHLYMVSSAGDFLPNRGRDLAFYNSLTSYSPENQITRGWPVKTGIKNTMGLDIYRLSVPVSAISLLANTRWDQFNPDGIMLKVYSTLESAVQDEQKINKLNQATLMDSYIHAAGGVDSLTVNKTTGYVFSGNMVEVAYRESINIGVNANGIYGTLNTAVSRGIDVSGLRRIYAINSAGDFSLGSGRGCCLFTDKYNLTSDTSLGVPRFYKQGVTVSGLDIYVAELPLNAASLIINTAFLQFNPEGFFVGIYDNYDAAVNEVITSGTRRVTSILGEEILGLNKDTDFEYTQVGVLTSLGSDNPTNYGITAQGYYGNRNTARSQTFDVENYDVLYLYNSAGDFSLGSGRGASFFNSLSNFSDDNLVATASYTLAGKTSNGTNIYKVIVPEGAVSLVVNTAFTQFNPEGFTVGVYTDLSLALSLSVAPPSRRVTSILGEEILGLNKDTDFEYTHVGVLTSLGSDNPTNYGITAQGYYGNRNTARSQTFDVENYDVLYLYNSAGDFSLWSGRGASFFNSLSNFSDDNLVATASYTLAGKTSNGTNIYKVIVPEGAVSLVVNTAFTQFNPDGFTVGVYTDLSLALSLSAAPPSRKITSILGEKILDLSKESGDDKFGLGRLAGEKVFIFGDSISTTNYNGGWVPYFYDATRCNLTNFSTNGSRADRMVDKLRIEGLARRAASDTQEWPKPDFSKCKAVMLMIGTNDRPQIPAGGIESIIPAGNLASAPDPMTYWNSFPNNYVGNVALFIEYVKYQNPATEIYLMSNVHIASDKNVMERVSALCAQIARYYSIPHIDATHNAGFSYKFINTYLSDGLHPTLQGNMLLGTYIASAVMSA
ncbi:SGNH/GDSL hydrolase family protein [Klebsiella sp. JB_Kp035]